MRNSQLQTAPISVVSHSFRLTFGRVIISRTGLERERLFSWNARARNTPVEATLNHPFAAQVAKWRAAGFDAIADMVGFREDNVIPTASFYSREVRYNYVADLTRDASAAVRLALCDCFAECRAGKG